MADTPTTECVSIDKCSGDKCICQEMVPKLKPKNPPQMIIVSTTAGHPRFDPPGPPPGLDAMVVRRIQQIHTDEERAIRRLQGRYLHQ